MLIVINHQEIWVKAMSYHHTPIREVTIMIKKSFFKKVKNLPCKPKDLSSISKT